MSIKAPSKNLPVCLKAVRPNLRPWLANGLASGVRFGVVLLGYLCASFECNDPSKFHLGSPAFAQPSSQQASQQASQQPPQQLPQPSITRLTPFGAERLASSDGRIPEWAGGLVAPPAGWRAEQGYANPFANDRPIEFIKNENQSAHADVLPDGLKELLRRYPHLQLPVYPTRRSAGYPLSILNQFEQDAGKAVLRQDGGIDQARSGSVAFREPRNGLEVIWNVILRYQGAGIEREGRAYAVRANGQSYPMEYWSWRIFAQNLQDAGPEIAFVALGGFSAPISLKGKIALIHEPIDSTRTSRKAWIYDPAQRRVRMAPDLGYDAVPEASEGMFTADQVDGFSGAPDRFEWKLIGKRPMIVPYNTYAIADAKIDAAQLLLKGSVNPQFMRYELHRVWIVEATLKGGQAHLYGKRRFYIDEDSWTVLVEEAYSRRGDLWRVALHGLVQYYDAPTPGIRVSIFHDLDSASYFVVGLDVARQPSVRFGAQARFSDFSSDALRRLGTAK